MLYVCVCMCAFMWEKMCVLLWVPWDALTKYHGLSSLNDIQLLFTVMETRKLKLGASKFTV